jgi:hypothetical protein
MRRLLRPAVIGVAAIIATLTFRGVALADATPVELVLLYMPNVSNTGTTAASGIAELVMQEGEFRLESADLPRLEDDGQYVAWVVNTGTNEFQRLGAFNTAESTGAVRYENILPDAIPNNGWDLLLVTVENSATPERPSNKHSIAGVFPGPDNQPLPEVLPNTGGDPDAYIRPVVNRPDWPPTGGLAALMFVLGGGAGYALGRKTR